MDRYTKGFVVASLVYFFLAALLGIWMGVGTAPPWALFSHVHMNLLGFMAMMIYGVGYFILPRFNARAIQWPALVGIHFYLAQIGLIGMTAAAADQSSPLFLFFALLNVAGVFLFSLNLGVTLLMPVASGEEEAGAAPAPAPPAPPAEPLILPGTRMGDILERWPELLDILVNNGFTPLADADHRSKIMSLPVTLEMACTRHDLDLPLLLSLLNKGAASLEEERSGPAPMSSPASTPAAAGGIVIGAALSSGQRITANHILGDIIKIYPATESVFRKYYGDACFSCPGQSTETVTQSAMMHNVSVEEILVELNRVAGVQ